MSEYLHKFGATVSSLTSYVEENTDLIAKAIYGSKTLQLLQSSGNVMVGYNQQTVKLNNLTHNIFLQDYGCGFTTSGSTVFAQESVTVKHIQLLESICPSDFEGVWMGKLLQDKTNPIELPFGKYIVETKAKALGSEVEYIAWQGNTTSGTGNLLKANGFIKALSGSTVDVYVSTAISGGTHTAANIISHVEAMITNIREQIAYEEDLYLFMSVANYKMYTAALRTANLYHYNGADGDDMSTNIPGTNVIAVATPGLRGLQTWYLTRLANMKVITNLMDDTERLEYWYDKSDRIGKIEGAMFLGFGFNEPAMVVHNNSAL